MFLFVFCFPYKPAFCAFLHQVSIFLKDKVQNSNGRFVLPTSGPVPYGTQVPGLKRYCNEY